MAEKIIVEPFHDGQVIRITLNAPKSVPIPVVYIIPKSHRP